MTQVVQSATKLHVCNLGKKKKKGIESINICLWNTPPAFLAQTPFVRYLEN